jgi:hypothetical protein
LQIAQQAKGEVAGSLLLNHFKQKSAMVSELRNRKGKDDTKGAGADSAEKAEILTESMRVAIEEKVRAEYPDASEKELAMKVEYAERQFMEKIMMLTKPEEPPLPGLSHEAKKAKDELAQDPYNLQLILTLGGIYLDEKKYKQAANVLIRGWKRMSELPEAEDRFYFLCRICEASIACNLYKQAFAVFKDMEEPSGQDPDSALGYHLIALRVHAEQNKGQNMQQVLKSFHKGVEISPRCSEPQKFLERFYMSSVTSLSKVGALDAARSSLSTKIPEEKLQALEFGVHLRENSREKAEKDPAQAYLQWFGILVSVLVFCGLLYMLEARSLQSLNLK